MSEQAERAVDPGALLAGAVTGVAVLLVGGLLAGAAAVIWPLSLAWVLRLAVLTQVLAGVAAGWRAGVRSRRHGLTHGLLAAVVLLCLLVVVDGARTAVPRILDVVRGGGLMLVGGAAGGVFGVNWRR